MRCSTERRILGGFIKAARRKSGLVQRDVADRMAYTSPQFVSNWERGVALPPIAEARKLAGILGVSGNALLAKIFECREADLREQLIEATRRLGDNIAAFDTITDKCFVERLNDAVDDYEAALRAGHTSRASAPSDETKT